MIALSVEDYLWFVDACLTDMVEIVTGLGDELANTRPKLPGANSPYAILTHCLGMMTWWSGEAVAGHPVQRDRDAEFVATGPVAELPDLVARARRALDADLERLEPTSPITTEPDDHYADTPYARTRAGVLMHVFHELAQHLGQMEITRDLFVTTGEPG
ncbi:MAG: DUF664 domain-containing protein [Actinomycetes bacterium]